MAAEPLPRLVSHAATRLLRFLGRAPATVRGGASGRIYGFAPDAAVQAVDERDVQGLLATGAFEKVDRPA